MSWSSGSAVRVVGALFVVLPLMGLSTMSCASVTETDTAPMTFTAIDTLGVFLEGVEVCATDTRTCVTTGADGRAMLEFSLEQPYSVTATKSDYGSYLIPNVMQNWWGFRIELRMASTSELATQHQRIGAQYPMIDTGTVVVRLEQELAGTTFELVDATGTAFYDDEEGHWSTELSATTASGSGGFAKVSPGNFRVRIAGTSWRCVPFHAWPVKDEDHIELPVRAGYLTLASARCATKPNP